MLNGRLQPKRTAQAARVLFILAGALSLATAVTPSFPHPQEPASRLVLRNAAADWIPALRQAGSGFSAGVNGAEAGQLPANAPPSTNPAKAQTPPRPNPNQSPFRVSGERTRTTPPKVTRREQGRTPTTRMAPTPPSKAVNQPPAARASGTHESEGPPESEGAESPQAGTPSVFGTAAGRRDPFRAWVAPSTGRRAAGGEAYGALPPGIRGLVISELRLEGVVREEPSHSMIAVVTNYTKRAYFLRVNDAVYNGVVSRITPEAVYFRQKTLDSSGRVAGREVEVKMGSAPGEER